MQGSSRLRGRCLRVVGLFGVLACSPATWRPEPRVPAEPSRVRGDASCGPEALDCNVCATNVQAQLDADRWEGGLSSWSFRTDRVYHGVTADGAYHGSILEHVQGFVRLNTGAEQRYLMVHSGEPARHARGFASLSLIEGSNGHFTLRDLAPVEAAQKHTSGLFTLGQHVGWFGADGVLTLMDVGADLSATPVAYRLPIADPRAHGISSRSGGVAMARLADGRYLLLTNEGGDGPSSGHSHFFLVNTDLQTLAPPDAEPVLDVTELGDWQYPHLPGGPSDYHHSENLSLITECTSGDLYVVHVGSSQSSIHALGPLGRTFWRVSRVVVFPSGGVALEPVGTYTRLSSIENCFGRAAGSAFVQADHRIELLCHERAHQEDSAPVWYFWDHLAAPFASQASFDPQSQLERTPSIGAAFAGSARPMSATGADGNGDADVDEKPSRSLSAPSKVPSRFNSARTASQSAQRG
jgi:hypothetical protein